MVQTSSITIRSAASRDLIAIERLLEANKLPLVGVREGIDDFLVAERDGVVVGVIGLEIYDDRGLLRSAAVDTDDRGSGVGAALVGAVIENGRARRLKELVLLTTTAEDWFPRFGFVTIARDETPIAVRQSAEFTGACPASATVMHLALGPAPSGGAGR
jgi:amino-acid N-acetyltransferase